MPRLQNVGIAMPPETLSPGQVAYRHYLQSEHWRNLRLQAFKTYGRRCAKCPATCRLDVHHIHYRNPWTSCVISDLQILCWKCHAAERGAVVYVPSITKKVLQKLSMKQRKRLKTWHRRAQSRRDRLRAINSKIYQYTKPYTAQRRWTNRGTSSN